MSRAKYLRDGLRFNPWLVIRHPIWFMTMGYQIHNVLWEHFEPATPTTPAPPEVENGN